MADVFGYYDTNRGLLGDALAPAGIAGGEYNPVTPLPTMNVAGGAQPGPLPASFANWSADPTSPLYGLYMQTGDMQQVTAAARQMAGLPPEETKNEGLDRLIALYTQSGNKANLPELMSGAQELGIPLSDIQNEAYKREQESHINTSAGFRDWLKVTGLMAGGAIAGTALAGGLAGGGAAGANAAGAPAAAGSSDVLGAGGLFGAGGAPSTLAGLGGGGLSSLNAGLAGAVDAGTAGLTAGVGGGLAGGTGLLNGGFGLEAGAGGAPAAGSLSESIAGTPFQASGEYGAVSGTPGTIPAAAAQASGEYVAPSSWLDKLNQLSKMGGGSPQGQAQSPQLSVPLMPQRSGGGFLQQLVKPRPNYLGRFGDAVMASQSANDLLLKSKLFGRERQ